METNNEVHPAFPQPAKKESLIWRYLDFYKFEWLVIQKRFFMPCANKLGDPHEGTTPQGELEKWKILEDAATSDEKRKNIKRNRDLLSQYAKGFRNTYYVSCWHLNEYENNAMWKCYTKNTDAIAIKSTYEALQNCLPTNVMMGQVRYIDYTSDPLPSMNMFEYIMHKDVHFKYENEIRAIAWRLLPGPEFSNDLFEKVDSPDFLVYAPRIDLQKLIHGIVLHPEISHELEEKVKVLCGEYNLPQPELSRSIRPIIF